MLPSLQSDQSVVNLKLYPKQVIAFQTTATEYLFGGASEGGKTAFFKIASIIWCDTVPNLQVYIFRKYYNDAITNYMPGQFGFKSLLREWVKSKKVKITENQVVWVETGSTINLLQCRTEEDFEKSQGIEKHLLIFDEAAQIKPRHIEGLRGWVRMPNDMKDKLPEQLAGLYPHLTNQERRDFFPRIIYGSNPIGAAVSFFRRHFVKARAPFAIERVDNSLGGFKRQYIPSRVQDNRSADQEAQRARLSGMGEQVATALIDGNWDAPIGDYFKEYNDQIHTVPDFTPPKHWFKYRTFDWGSSEPFAVYWIAVSDGQVFKDQNGFQRWFPIGALIVYREWYGCDELDHAKGLRMRNPDIAKGITNRTKENTSGYTLTDSLPFQDRGFTDGKDVYLISDDFKENGVILTLGNTKRIHGWTQMRARLSGVDGMPMIFFCQSCKFIREYIPMLGYSQSNTEDAAESGEATHSCDAIRLACTARPLIKTAQLGLPKPASTDKLTVNTADLIRKLSKN